MILALARRLTRRFARSEDGAVTVDFVVLCGTVVGISLAGANAIYTNVVTTVEESPIPTEAANGG